MAQECVIAHLAYHFANKGQVKIESVEQYAKLHDEICKGATASLVQAMKTKEGTIERLHKLSDLWDAAIEYLLAYEHKKPEEPWAKLKVGLRTLNMQRQALMGNLVLLKHPHLRERITNPPGKSAGTH